MLMIRFNRSSFKFFKIKSKLEINKLPKLALVQLLVSFIKIKSSLPIVEIPKDSLLRKINMV